MLKKLSKKLLVPVLVAVLTLAGNYGIQQLIQAKGRAVLSKDVNRTDLSSLPPDVQKQISFISVNYSLQHRAGGPAQKVTILIKNDALVQIADLKFSTDSEDHQVSLVDPHTVRVDVPTIRPGGFVNFQLLTTPANQIKFSELSDNAQIVPLKGVEAEQHKNTLIEYCVITAAVIAWVALLSSIIVMIWRTKKTWQEMEGSTTESGLRKGLILLIVILFIYNTVLSSFSLFGAWLPVPRISFTDLTSAFIFYLVVTRYKLVEAWLTAKTDQLKSGKN